MNSSMFNRKALPLFFMPLDKLFPQSKPGPVETCSFNWITASLVLLLYHMDVDVNYIKISIK